MIEIDLDDFSVVLERAAALWGTDHLPTVELAEISHCCGRALAFNRLCLRRYAAVAPRRGEALSFLNLLPLIDGEIVRLRAELAPGWKPECIPLEAILEGCGCYDCLACHPPRRACCGGSCAPASRTP